MRWTTAGALVCVGLLALVAPVVAAPVVAAPSATAQDGAPGDATGIRWFAGDVDAAFAHAKRNKQPLFLYWGAVWCPPCNQVKATIFNRADFIERSRVFVPVYIDGDSPAAQKLGARFKVSGYPTMVLFRPDGTEVTRLPGEVDAEQYMQVLALGVQAARPVKQLVAAALAAPAAPGAKRPALTNDDWRLLAYYSWETDEQAAVPKARLASTLARLARACPPGAGDAGARLQLKAVIASAREAAGGQKVSRPADAKSAAAQGATPGVDRAAARRQLNELLADARQARAMFSVLTDSPDDVAALLTAANTPERAQLAAAWDRALAGFAADNTLSQTDRLGALVGRIALARLDTMPGALPAPLVDAVRADVARADRETTDRYERQSVISAAGYALREAGLLDESDALLKAELSRSHSPYYFMLGLASNAKKRGDASAALDWYAKAYEAAQGPATRLQWGASYVRGLLELAPQDAARIESAARAVLGELEAKPETFHARNQAVLDAMGKRLGKWAGAQKQDAVLAALRMQMDAVCAKLPAQAPERTRCRQVLRPAAA